MPMTNTHDLADSMMQRQLTLEEESVQLGVTAYRKTTADLEGAGLQTKTDYGKRLLAVTITPMAAAIIQFVTDAYAKVGPKAAAIKYLEVISPDVAAFISVQVILDGVAGQRSYQHLSLEIGARMEDEARFGAFEKENKPLFNGVMKNLEKHPMGYQNRVRRSMLVRTANKFNIQWSKWPHREKVLLGSTLLDLFMSCTEPALVTTDEKLKGNRGRTIITVTATPELSERIRGYKEWGEMLRPRMLPMVVAPKPWTTPNDGGYYSKRLAAKLVKSRNKGYQQELRHHEMPVVYDSINTLQATPWKINPAMHTIVKELWEAGLEVKGFPPRTDYPIPVEPNYETHPDQWKVWKKEAGDLFRANVRLCSKRIQTSKILWIAGKFAEEKSIWFPVQTDFRGRIYAMPQYLNPQGCDLAKALLTFSEGKPLGQQGVYWLAIHIANCFGFDKVSMVERVKWTKDNSARIEAAANDPLSERWWMEADKPFQFLAACIEWLGYLHDGGENYSCSLPIMVDGSCNGLQHFSAMLRDETCGAHVNLVPQEKPADIYQAVADQVTKFLSEEQRPEFTTFAYLWIQYGVNRKLCKRPVMVLPYGGTRDAVRKYILEYVMERTIEGHHPHPFGETLIRACNYLAGVVWEQMKEVVKGPRVAMDWLQKATRIITKQGLRLNWHTPAGFWVQQMYPDLKDRRVKTKIGGVVVRVMVREEIEGKIDSRKQAQAVAPNFVHSLDAAALMLTIIRAKSDGVRQFAAIHDSYGTVAADMPILLDTLREQFVQMYRENDVLAGFASQVTGALADGVELPAFPAKGSLDLEGVLSSDFFFA